MSLISLHLTTDPIQFRNLFVNMVILMLQCSSFTPECDENLKPKVGMTFEGLEGVEKFYKAYAHNVGFGVRIGQQKKIANKVVRTKRFMCNREGFNSKLASYGCILLLSAINSSCVQGKRSMTVEDMLLNCAP